MRILVERGVNTTTMDDGTMVILSERTGRYHRTNRTGTAMWQALISHEGHPDQAAGAVAEQHGIEVDRVLSDLGRFIEQLHGAGLVRVDA